MVMASAAFKPPPGPSLQLSGRRSGDILRKLQPIEPNASSEIPENLEFRKGVRGARCIVASRLLGRRTFKFQLGKACAHPEQFGFCRKELGTCFDAMADG
jgi:hypothetical protein